jgi:hypothetical protein
MKLLTLRDHGGRVRALPFWLTDPLRDQFAALLPDRPAYDPAHPLGYHRRRIADRIVFDKLPDPDRYRGRRMHHQLRREVARYERVILGNDWRRCVIARVATSGTPGPP